MFNIYSISAFTQSVLPAEVCNAVSLGETAIMEAAIQNASEELYAIDKSTCKSRKRAALCLFFYTYALESYCSTGDNYLSEEQLMAILACIEQTSNTCCNG